MLITNFSGKEWQQLNEIFFYKPAITLEYEGRKLVTDGICRSGWTPEEDTLLDSIVMEDPANINKWNDHARKMYDHSEKQYFRTGKQCRERWLNHLDTSKKHGEWTPEEDLELAHLVICDGKKWSLVSKKMTVQRTEHTVKNRFKSIVARQKKTYPTISSEKGLLRLLLQPDCSLKRKSEEEQLQALVKKEVERVEQAMEEVEKKEPEIKSEY